MARRGAAALVFALACAGVVPAHAQQQDTLVYSVAIVADGHLNVEARLTLNQPGVVVLASPPAAAPARTTVTALAATDDRGSALEVRRGTSTWTIGANAGGAVRFRYRLDLQQRVPEGSTGSGLDSTHFYAVTRSIFVAPDPTALRKSGRTYPMVSVSFFAPPGWQVIAGWPQNGLVYLPADGDDLLGATVAAAPDFRLYDGEIGTVSWQLAIRGHRYFTDSSLVGAIRASIERGAETLGPVPVAKVSFTGDVGRKGRTSGSLQGLSSIGLIWEPSEILATPRIHDLFHETLHLWFGGAMETERWWIEGVTDYLAARLYAGWRERPEELATLCYQSLRNYQHINHSGYMTMAEENRRRMGGDNTELLVYRKGMLAGLLLDAAIRRSSNGRRTLDDVSRQLLHMAAERRSRVLRETEIRDAVRTAGGEEALRVWHKVVEGTEMITEGEVSDALRIVTGRTFEPPRPAKGRKQLIR